MGTSAFESTIKSSLFIQNESIEYSNTSEWIANIKELNELVRAAWNPFSFRTDILVIEGIVVLTDQRVIFAQWLPELKRYGLVLSVVYNSIASVRIDTYGQAKGISLNLKDGAWHLFRVMQIFDRGKLVNSEEAETVYKMIAAHIP